MAEPRWLAPAERELWLTLLAVTDGLPASIDAELRRASRVTLFEYSVLAMLSESETRTRPMSDLAVLTNGSLSRLSHAVRKLEARGLISREASPEDRRTTLATITSNGMRLIEKAAPGHVEDVRRQVFDKIPADKVEELTRLLAPLAAGAAPRPAPPPAEPQPSAEPPA